MPKQLSKAWWLERAACLRKHALRGLEKGFITQVEAQKAIDMACQIEETAGERFGITVIGGYKLVDEASGRVIGHCEPIPYMVHTEDVQNMEK